MSHNSNIETGEWTVKSQGDLTTTLAELWPECIGHFENTLRTQLGEPVELGEEAGRLLLDELLTQLRVVEQTADWSKDATTITVKEMTVLNHENGELMGAICTQTFEFSSSAGDALDAAEKKQVFVRHAATPSPSAALSSPSGTRRSPRAFGITGGHIFFNGELMGGRILNGQRHLATQVSVVWAQDTAPRIQPP